MEEPGTPKQRGTDFRSTLITESMSLEDRMKTDIDRRIRHLREEYGGFEVDEETVENNPEFFEHGRQLALEGWRGDAGAWITDTEGHVLLIRHAAAPSRWGIPGGGHEPSESHEETARREIQEETGLDCELTGIFRVRQTEIVLETDHSHRLSMLTVNFEGATENSGIDSGDDEILEAQWFATPLVDGVADFLADKTTEWENRIDI
jgi:8-oxo-dGTP pyrophosphatase MutT (NUDIX family)